MKFLSYHFDPKANTTSVCVEHMGKVFEGVAKVHPDDVDLISDFTGGRYAETRATVKALKYERKIAREKCEECRKLVNACRQYKDFDPTSPTAKAMFRQLNMRIKKVDALTEEISMLLLSIETDKLYREKTLKAIRDRRNKGKES